MNWELIANSAGSAGTNFDQVSVGSSVDWADTFWNVKRSWMAYDLSTGTAGSLSNLAIGGALLGSLGNSLSPAARGFFTTSLSGQDVMLNFTAVPEPSFAMIVLAGLGLAGVAIGARRSARAGR